MMDNKQFTNTLRKNGFSAKCSNCNELSQGDSFCTKCEKEGYHHCEKCGKVIKESLYDESFGGLICMDGCHKDELYGEQLEENEYREIQEEQEMIAKAERETFRELNGFSEEEDEYIKREYGEDALN